MNKPYCFTVLNQLHLFRISDTRGKFQPERYSQAILICKTHSCVDSLLNARIVSQGPIVFFLIFIFVSYYLLFAIINLTETIFFELHSSLALDNLYYKKFIFILFLRTNIGFIEKVQVTLASLIVIILSGSV